MEAGLPEESLAFDDLYRAHFAFVWRNLRRLGVPVSSLDDAAQEVFLVVHRRLAEFKPEGSVRSWLFAIVHRVASDQRRWLRRKGAPLQALDDEPAALAPSPLEHALTREASDLVSTFLESLDPARRTVFILAELEQMTAPEIARCTATNVNTVYFRVASARKAFIAFATQHASTHPEGTP